MIHFKCPSCSKSLAVNDALAGKTGKCSGCGKPCRVPPATQATPPEAPPIVTPPVAPSIFLPAIRTEPSATGDAVLDVLPAVKRGLTTAAAATGKATVVTVRGTGKAIAGIVSATGKVISTASENAKARRIEAEVEREIAKRELPPPSQAFPQQPQFYPQSQPPQQPQQPQQIIIQNTVTQIVGGSGERRKSIILAFFLAFLFGPFGMFYSTVGGGLLFLVLDALLVPLTFGLILLLTWPLGCLWAAAAASRS
jgi:hypothetical protein